jgi:hypothetical protein
VKLGARGGWMGSLWRTTTATMRATTKKRDRRKALVNVRGEKREKREMGKNTRN